MPDREKVIKALTDALAAKENYPWAKAEMSFEFIEMLLELLKDKEHVKPLKKMGTSICECSNCGHLIAEGMNYCPVCGRIIDWNDV